LTTSMTSSTSTSSILLGWLRCHQSVELYSVRVNEKLVGHRR
jgi:hypothetical protein